jgi:phosphoglycolate phosphatase-like HAD superfamily hydrolase
MTYVFDLDNTLCETKSSDYANSKPLLDRIEIVNKLYDDGNTVTIYTARGMGSTDNNQIKAIKKYYSLTESQLKLWGVKYHNLILGKPSGDCYIDDKGINDNEFFKRNTP